jgi:hypothetical protein
MHESKAPQPRDRAVPLVYFRVAALNLATRSAGTRPRSFTSMPCALVHSRTSVLSAPAAGALRPPRAGRHAPPPAGCAARTWRQRIPQRLGVPGVQVDLILGAVQPEADSALSLAAIKVLDEQGLYLLGHRFAISSLPHHQPRPAETYKSATTRILSAHKPVRPSRRTGAYVPIRSLRPAARDEYRSQCIRRVPRREVAGLRAIRAATRSQSWHCPCLEGTVRPSPHVSQ